MFTMRGPKLQRLLALLVVRANRIVPVETLVDELWSETPPRTAVPSVRTHVYHLRTSVRAIGELLVTEPSGYMLKADPDSIDSEVFTRRVKHAKELLAGERVEEASRTLRGALAMWRGQPMANVDAGPVLTRHAVQLREARLIALQLRIEADMLLDRHRELIGELKEMVATDPYNEWFHARLIDALNRSGRRREALGVFQSLRSKLSDELGVEPSEEVQRVHQEVLDPS
ncbi:MAG TPA: AfsR/SARP family transcriptional regulator [Streptosporangiaceae bacterium]|jgi:DNA-binding SARP family transcriptional activator|nr:AfsR/SARP family transcriptional regulator [Streptosporangiaceae bacterium]